MRCRKHLANLLTLALFLLLTTAVQAMPPIETCTIPTSGEVARWQGDGDAQDSVDGNHGTPLNGAGYGSGLCAFFDQAFAFDGVNDYVSVPDSASVSLTSAFTLAAWIKPMSPANGNVQGVLSKPRDGGGTGYRLGLAPTVRCGWG